MRSSHPIRSLAAALLAAFLVIGGTGACARNSGISERGLLFSADLRPLVDGEIYSVTLQGRRTDLSRSFYADTEPLISPDGKRVAFLSGRAGYPAVYIVGIDGRGLKRVSPELPKTGSDDWNWLTWSPDGTQLAAVFSGNTDSLFLLTPSRRPRRIARESEIDGIASPPAWSPDGRLIAYARSVFLGGDNYASDQITVITPAGRHVFTVPDPNYSPPQWSPAGQLIVQGNARVRLYDRRGKLLAVVAGQTLAFSPDGKRLATVLGRKLEVRDGGGLGRVILREAVISSSAYKKLTVGTDYTPWLSWLGMNRVAVSLAGFVERRDYKSEPAVGVDVPSGHIRSTSYRVWLSRQSCLLMNSDCGSPDHSLIAETVRTRNQFALRVARVDGSSARTLALVPGCYDEHNGFGPAISNLQFSPNGRTLVYQSDCATPYANLYSLSPDGGNLRRLTHVETSQTNPELSPDGRRIAFLQGDCGYCWEVRVMDADGKHPRGLTSPPGGYFDVDPSWSPDGREIIFSRESSDGSTLYIVSANGGQARSLRIQGSEPAWGPHLIAYEDGDVLWTAAPDGTNRRRISPKPSRSDPYPAGNSPAWSRDGRLAWLSTSDGTPSTIEVLTPAGQRSSFSLGDLGTSVGPTLAWSPDGRSLAFTASSPDGSYDVYTISDKGANLKRLTYEIGASSVGWR